MNPISLFTSFKGRIGRTYYWIGLIVLILISPFSFGAVFSADPFSEAISYVRSMGLQGLAWSLALLFPLAALNTKRLHDLGRSGLVGLLFYAPAALSAVTMFTGWTPRVEQIHYWTSLLAGIVGATGLWFLVRLGFSRGTRGANKYGPDPRD